ncbi:domain-containing protein 1 [Byssothecium circinans]|uniref:Domain-containing protein 1 n=1 Tax=Byssothecium circinans TaxID=147558 RepID=A0A6A5U1D9_9PLEO|nr:domain-containing protein 1 [Byssothecium circinans]
MTTTTLISSTEQLSDVLAKLDTSYASPPSLYIDLDGIKLSRNGTISLITLLNHPSDTVYLIDVHELGAATFTTPATSPTPTPSPAPSTNINPTTPPHTLQSILESPTIPKVFFDVRNDSDALFAHYNIKLQGIQDLQLMELASRTRPKAYLNGLARCIQDDLPLSAALRAEIQKTKDAGVRLFAPEKGGSYEAFNQRPLLPELERYCVQDVVFMPRLWQVYEGRLRSSFWRWMAADDTLKRVRDSQKEVLRPDGKWKAEGWSSGVVGEAQKRWRKR